MCWFKGGFFSSAVPLRFLVFRAGAGACPPPGQGLGSGSRLFRCFLKCFAKVNAGGPARTFLGTHELLLLAKRSMCGRSAARFCRILLRAADAEHPGTAAGGGRRRPVVAVTVVDAG